MMETGEEELDRLEEFGDLRHADLLVRALGSIEVRNPAERTWRAPSPQQRTLLAVLVAHVGRPCSSDQLAQALWGDDVPVTARRLLQALVSRLRCLIEPAGRRMSRLRTTPGGWQLDIEPDVVDTCRFERLLRAAAEAPDADGRETRTCLQEALALWRGRPFGDLADHSMLKAEAVRLEEQFVGARERLLALRVDAGEHAEVVPELEELVVAHPLRERLWELLMLALWRSGRQADALTAYQGLRGRLVDELGTDPGPQLQELHALILRHEVPLGAAVTPGRAATPSQRSVQKTLTWSCRRDLPLTGRERELATLRDTLRRAHRGLSQLVLLGGEPGIGKTRLVAEFADVAAGEGVDVLIGRCAEGARVPYQPFVEALAADVEATPQGGLAARLGRDAVELTRLLPTLAARTGWEPPARSASPELDQHCLFTAVAGWLTAASAQAPLMLIAEDVHAATRSTWLLLDHVAHATTSARVLVLATYRDTADWLPGGLADTVAALIRRPQVTQLSLAGLDVRAVASLITACELPGDGSTGWAEAVHAATGGNPLFVEEMLATLAADPPADPGLLTSRLDVPHGVAQLVATRLRRLTPATVAMLEHAAVAGERFDFLETTHASGLVEEQALDAVAEASAARLVTPTGSGDEYAFTHSVMRAALLTRLTPSRRMRLHARMAATLEACHGDDPEQAGLLAYHHGAAGPGGDPAKIVHYAMAAGDAAMAQRAYDDAAAYYQQALALCDLTDTRQRCELLTRLGCAQARAGHPDGHATLHEALALALSREDPDQIVEAALAGNRGLVSRIGAINEDWVSLLHQAVATVSAEHPGPRAVLLAIVARELSYGDDLPHRRRVSREALDLARRQDDPLVLARVLALRWVAIQHPATLADRLADTAELVGRVAQLDDPLVEVLAHTQRFIDTLEAGDRVAADAALDHACRVAEDVGHAALQAFVTTADAARELLWGDCDRAEDIAEHGRALAHRAGVPDIEIAYLAQQFLLHRERGQLTDYLPVLDQALRAYGVMPAWQGLASLAWALTGHHDRAWKTVDRYAANDFADIPRNPLWVDTVCMFADAAAQTLHRQAADALLNLLAPYRSHLAIEISVPLGAVAHYLGVLATTTEQWQHAVNYLNEAEDIHDRMGATRWHNRTRLARARLCVLRGDPEEHNDATQLLDEVTTRARDIGQMGLLHEAHAVVP